MITHNLPLFYGKSKYYSDLMVKLSLSSSNYAYLKHIFMVPKAFEPLKFGFIMFCKSLLGVKFYNVMFPFSVVAYSVALGLIMSVGRQVTGKLPTGKVGHKIFSTKKC